MGNEFILLPKAASDLESIFQYISIERENPESHRDIVAISHVNDTRIEFQFFLVTLPIKIISV